jgi:hypothetical protein
MNSEKNISEKNGSATETAEVIQQSQPAQRIQFSQPLRPDRKRYASGDQDASTRRPSIPQVISDKEKKRRRRQKDEERKNVDIDEHR